MSFADARSAPGLTGRGFVGALTGRADQWLAGLFAEAAGASEGDAVGLSLVAVGGYGRAELCPFSDLDVVLLHAGRPDVGEVAERLWYPVWDEGVKLGHAVRSIREALALAADDLDTATALLDVRHLAGDPSLTASLATGAVAAWEKRGRRWLSRLADSVDARHARSGEVAFHLEPDLKAGRGGLRDVHALRWAGRARRVSLADDLDDPALAAAYDALLAARVELHRRTGRATDVLVLQEQDGVAEALGDPDADALMARVAAAGRRIAWRSDESWRRVRSQLAGPAWTVGSRPRLVAPGVERRDGQIHLTATADPATDPAVALRAAAAAAAAGTGIDRASLDRLAAETPPFPDPWPAGAVDALVALLLAGPAAIAVVASLDQRGLVHRVLPEWEPTRSRPQRNAYHRFTVDRHLCEAAANAAALADRVARPDLLVLGTLLHDIGKGRPGDHTEVGMRLVATIGARMGLDPGDVDVLVELVHHHLLLPDVATRRDLSDEATIAAVAAAVGTVGTLELLAALTEADSLATGPAAWGRWKAELVAELVERTAAVLGGSPVTERTASSFPTAAERALLEAREPAVLGEGHTLTVVAHDRPGLFSRVAGVLALHGLGVRSADALVDERSFALERFVVESGAEDDDTPVDWPRVTADLDRAFAGRLALRARLDERARTYARRRRSPAVTPEVRVDHAASATATVIEVHAADAVGLLYRITRALAEMDADIRIAKVQTLGDSVVDAFYVVGDDGGPIADPTHLDEIQRAVLHAVGAG